MSSLIDLLSEKTIKRNDDDDDEDNHKFMEITLVADKATILYHGDDTVTHLLMLANLVSLYQSPSCGLLLTKHTTLTNRECVTGGYLNPPFEQLQAEKSLIAGS